MSWYSLARPGGNVWGLDDGIGRTVVFQHGLGGDEAQVTEVFPTDAPLRRLTLECRAHGRSDPFLNSPYSIEAFTDDVLAFADARGVERFVAGGISMGAAIALRLAVRASDRVSALVLARPAWLWGNAPSNMRPFGEAAALIAAGAVPGRDQFGQSAIAAHLAKVAPDNLASMMKFFDRPSPEVTARLLASISADGPNVTREEMSRIDVPTLVIGHGRDYVHPLRYAQQLADCIPGARFVEITPKVTDLSRYITDFRAALGGFLREPRVKAGVSHPSGDI
jgi:pimeloyl-ACP methyl ester carboxylesterase